MSPQEIADKCVRPADAIRRLQAENDRLRRDLESERNLRMLDKAEVIRLRRMVEAAIEDKEGALWRSFT